MIDAIRKENAFTLAEVLITLAIIGVVSAITIPTLVTNYQNKTWNTAATVFERKLEEALKTMNTQQTLAGYKNTEDFVNELSKHFKISKICKNDELTSCFSDKVYWGTENEEIDMTKIKNASNFGQKDWDTETVGLQFANGTTGVIAYNPDCRQNPYSNQITGTSCIALLYDTSGMKNPNTQNKDLRSINVANLGGSNCVLELGGVCFTSPFLANEPLTHDECVEHKDEWQIVYCIPGDDDYWGGVVKRCGGTQNMPTSEDLAKLADYLYNTSGIGPETSFSKSDGLEMNPENLVLGFGGGSIDFLPIPNLVAFSLYANEESIESDLYVTYGRFFGEVSSLYGYDIRTRSKGVGVCIAQ